VGRGRRRRRVGMPAAARVGDMHVCRHKEPVPHVGGPIVEGCPTVLIGERQAARERDAARCEGGSNDIIIDGESTVLIGQMPAARQGDATEGGHITSGLQTVLIGRAGT